MNIYFEAELSVVVHLFYIDTGIHLFIFDTTITLLACVRTS